MVSRAKVCNEVGDSLRPSNAVIAFTIPSILTLMAAMYMSELTEVHDCEKPHEHYNQSLVLVGEPNNST